MRVACLFGLLGTSSAFPKIRVSYFDGYEGACDSGEPATWEWVWDIGTEECFSFIAPNNDATGNHDALSKPIWDGTWLNYTHMPRNQNCDGRMIFMKSAAVAPSCLLQTEGKAYTIRVTCIQNNEDEDECQVEPYENYLARWPEEGVATNPVRGETEQALPDNAAEDKSEPSSCETDKDCADGQKCICDDKLHLRSLLFSPNSKEEMSCKCSATTIWQ